MKVRYWFAVNSRIWQNAPGPHRDFSIYIAYRTGSWLERDARLKMHERRIATTPPPIAQ